MAMSDHEKIRELLELAVAGALTPDDQELVDRHVIECAVCAAELSDHRLLAAGLRSLPVPQPSAELLSRTHTRVTLRMKMQADQRWEQWVMIFLMLFGWLLAVASWLVIRFLSGNYLVWLTPGFTRPWLGLSGYSMLLWLTGGMAAVALGVRHQRERRMI
jgi:roadblock/LC7 domain-containing protein